MLTEILFGSVISSQITFQSFMLCILAAMILGVCNALCFTRGERHTPGFAVTLALLPMCVAVVIMLVNGNVGTGVAVAGAFALVRFRSMPGTAKEIAALFTAMAVGLAAGMGYIGFAAVFVICLAVFVSLLSIVSFGGSNRSEKELKITIPENYDYNGLFDDLFEKYTTGARLEKIRTTNMGTLYELTYAVTLKDIAGSADSGSRSGAEALNNKKIRNTGCAVPKEFIDALRTRNGNLNIVIGGFSEKDML